MSCHAEENVMSRPLDGVTVVTIEQAVAAPLATRNLADLGARVIKVERVDGGDFARGYDHVVYGTWAHFVWLNRAKESIAVDLKVREGCAVVRRLAERADVFVQNLAPGAAERLGLGAEELWSSHPPAGRGEPVRVRDRRPDGAAQDLRHAHSGRGRAHLGHGHAPDSGQDRHPDGRHRRRHVLLPGDPGRVAAPVAHRGGRHHRGVHVRGHRRLDGSRAVPPDAHRQPALQDGTQPQLHRPVRRVPDPRRPDSDARDILGGNGLLLENHVARHLTDMEVVHTYEGTDNIQSLLIGRDITGISAIA